MSDWWICGSHIHWVVWGTGTPTDRDEVNRREFWVYDGWVCDLEDIGVSSIFKTIRSDEVLVRMFPTLDLRCEDNTDRRKWKLVDTMWTPEGDRKRSVSRWVSKNNRRTNSQSRFPGVGRFILRTTVKVRVKENTYKWVSVVYYESLKRDRCNDYVVYFVCLFIMNR